MGKRKRGNSMSKHLHSKKGPVAIDSTAGIETKIVVQTGGSTAFRQQPPNSGLNTNIDLPYDENKITPTPEPSLRCDIKNAVTRVVRNPISL